MKHNVIHFLESVYPLIDALKNWLIVHLKQRILSRKERFLSAGTVSNNISFIAQGLLRSYHKKERNRLAPELLSILFLFFIGCSCLAQTRIVSVTQRKVLSDLCQNLKKSNITYKPNTQIAGLGVYEEIAGKYFDKVEMTKNFEEDTSYYDLTTKFLFVQNYLRLLDEYYKYLPAANLKLLEYAQSEHLDSSWRSADKDEIETIKNAYIVLYADATKKIELMIIYFNPKNNRIFYLSDRSLAPEDLKYLNNIKKGDRKGI